MLAISLDVQDVSIFAKRLFLYYTANVNWIRRKHRWLIRSTIMYSHLIFFVSYFLYCWRTISFHTWLLQRVRETKNQSFLSQSLWLCSSCSSGQIIAHRQKGKRYILCSFDFGAVNSRSHRRTHTHKMKYRSIWPFKSRAYEIKNEYKRLAHQIFSFDFPPGKMTRNKNSCWIKIAVHNVREGFMCCLSSLPERRKNKM